MKHLAIFASGRGSNAEAIIRFFQNHPKISVALIVTNNPDAGVIQIARQYHIPYLVISKKQLSEGTVLLKTLQEKHIDFIVLAGFILLLPPYLIDRYPGRIVNIHPALLPKFGGKGMYGIKVHEAVLKAGERQTGITIHYVDEQYDHGAIILQKTCAIQEDETPGSLMKKVQQLEHYHYPRVIESLILKEETLHS
ncbi:MAG: phosphoribosylglycinamide formyltransferase [Chitinophagales bacterium]|nr:MAG: phosphoribosylglycinamide formyltransferase [Chitinophagales bacterium]